MAFIVLVACGGDARPTSSPHTEGSVARPAAPTREERCRDAARACGAALIAGDNDKIIDCMPAEALAFVGGRDKVMAELASGMAGMAKEGWAIEHADLDSPKEIVAAGAHLFAIVPQKVTLKNPTGHVAQRGYLLGVSSDGTSWKFIDGVGLTPANVKAMYPDFPASIVLPERVKPEVVP